MKELCTMYFNMGMDATVLILLVLLIRFCFRKGPRRFYMVLWGLCGLRLLVPFTIESHYSLVPPTTHTTNNLIQSLPVDLSMEESITVATTPSSVTMLDILSILWIVGMIVMLGYFIVSYLALYHKTKQSVLYQEQVYLCDNIDTPFVLGIIHPKIYIPSDLNESYYEHIIHHEKIHIKNKDYFWKLFSYMILCIHWYHIFVWKAYIMFNKDIECACDEKVVAQYHHEQKKDYLNALLACSVHQKTFMHFSLGFSQSDIKKRVENLLNYQKTTKWMIILSVLLCVLITCFCMTKQPDTRWYPIYEEIVSEYHDINEKLNEIYLWNYDQMYIIHNEEKEFNDCLTLLQEIKVNTEAFVYDDTIESKHQIHMQFNTVIIHFNEDCTVLWLECFDPTNNTINITEMYQVKNHAHIQKYFRKAPGQLTKISTFHPKGHSFVEGLKIESFELNRIEQYIAITWLNTSDHKIEIPYGYNILKKSNDKYIQLNPNKNYYDEDVFVIESGKRVGCTYDISNYDLPSQGDFQFVLLKGREVVGYYLFYDNE